MKSIEKVLELYQTRNNIYPNPTNSFEVTYSGAEVWTQGTFGEETRKTLGQQGQISETPTDPLTTSEYSYSILNTKREYEIAVTFEGDYLGQNNNKLLNETYAAGLYGTTYLKGTYNLQVANTNTGSKTYILAVPSIISGEVSLSDTIEYETILNNKKLVYNKSNIIPASYSGTTSFDTSIIPTNNIVNTGSIVVLSGSTDTLNTNLSINTNLQDVMIDNLKLAYENTEIETEPQIKTIVNSTSGNKTYIAQTIIRSNVIPSLEVTAENNSLPTIPTDGLISEYLLGNNANDEMGNYNGIAILPSVFNGTYADFTTINDYIEVDVDLGENWLIKNQPWSFTTWIKPNTNGYFFGTQFNNIGYGYDGIAWGVGSSGHLMLVTLTEGRALATRTYQLSSLGLNLGNWNNIALVSDGTNIKLYINNLKDINEFYFPSNYPTTRLLNKTYIGSVEKSGGTGDETGTAEFYGSLGRLKIYNRELSESDILDIYNAEKAIFGL